MTDTVATDQEIQDAINAQSRAADRAQVEILIANKEAEIEALKELLGSEDEDVSTPESAPEPEPQPEVEVEAEVKVEAEAETETKAPRKKTAKKDS